MSHALVYASRLQLKINLNIFRQARKVNVETAIFYLDKLLK